METLLELELAREGTLGATARRALEEQLTGELTPEFLEDLQLIATELAENAYVHGAGRIWLKLARGDRRVRLEVVDEGDGATVKVNSAPSGAGGYGLRIVDELADAWGAYEGTTHVWASSPCRRTDRGTADVLAGGESPRLTREARPFQPGRPPRGVDRPG